MARFSPAFCRTFVPGASTVPLAERVMLRTRRSSTRIRSKRRARSVENFSTQSLRASARRACRRANLALTRRQRLLPGWARPSRRWVRRTCASRESLSRESLSRESLSNRRSSPLDSAAATATPRSADDPEALVPAGLAPGRPPVGAAVEIAPGLVEIAPGLLLDGLAAGGQRLVL